MFGHRRASCYLRYPWRVRGGVGAGARVLRCRGRGGGRGGAGGVEGPAAGGSGRGSGHTTRLPARQRLLRCECRGKSQQQCGAVPDSSRSCPLSERPLAGRWSTGLSRSCCRSDTRARAPEQVSQHMKSKTWRCKSSSRANIGN